MTRYEIREIDLTDVVTARGTGTRRYVVWDCEANHQVPFGIYLARAEAGARIEREEIRNG